ncbi:hypothetical protein [Paenibacillus sp. 481]|uniref:hypothetical protein n=1 Tax=Paenibacillus sp. 481 TaxID=2835869 RepID=UPI001E5C192B|nr:hypothetical protein [Paenibacillus sp. 481]UHA74521.1 hypothetical protein KIK04_05320 [Paenibacillus sp. 481]
MAKELINRIFATFSRKNNTEKMINTVISANGNKDTGRYQAFHEITQIIAGRSIHRQTGLATQLEYHIEEQTPWWRPNKHYWVDIVTSNFQMWEVKPRKEVFSFNASIEGLYENAEAQLNKYASLNNKLKRGQQFDDILGVGIVGDLKMNIDFYDKKFNAEEEKIKEKIMSVHVDFFWEMNLKDRNDPKNKEVAKEISNELREIREMLDDLNN